MIKEFESVKKQLGELAPIINSFKSEAVQVRIVDLVFQVPSSTDLPSPQVPIKEPSKPQARRKSSRSEGKGRAGSGKLGAVGLLDALIAEKFFSTKRILSEIIEHASNSKAKQFKASDLSGPLGRFVRAGKLKRVKNGNKQFAYFKE